MKRKANLRRLMAFLLSMGLMLSTYTSAFEVESEGNDSASSITDMEVEEETVYTLYLTHYFRFTVNGEGRHVQAEETIELTEADFEDGVCDISRFAYDAQQLTVTEADPLSLEVFDENQEGGARIVYSVSSGWKVVPVGESGNEGTVLRDVFQGELSDYEFVPADVIRVNVEYKYSNTGGLAGIDAASPEIVEALPVKNAEGKYELEFPLPVKVGFRIVLNPEPLNDYLVKAPTGNETPEQLREMLQNGSFNGDVEHKYIYAYQENSGNLLAEPDYTVLNKDGYGNRYSTEYNQAWNKARILAVGSDTAGYTAQACCGSNAHASHEIGNQGANALEDPKLKVTLNEAQLQNALENGLSITVSYRRNATWYTVNHWVPKDFAKENGEDLDGMVMKDEGGVTYVLLHVAREQGRVGGLTRATVKTGGVYDLLVPRAFSQKSIQSEDVNTNTGTTVDIYYEPAESYRVIFDTDHIYIPRQQVPLEDGVDFSFMDELTPTRKGYEFAGWQYINKDARPDENGEYSKDSYTPVDVVDGKYTLEITAELITQKAKLKEIDGVQVLRLYPIWREAETQVTVILWTEDLTWLDDVQATAEGGNASYYNEKYANYRNAPVTHKPGEGADYSNVGSFTMDVITDSSLVAEGDSSVLRDTIQAEVEKKFATSAKVSTGTDYSQFYTQCSFQILHETGGEMDYSTTTANADGKTMIYVYFTRNIYTLLFHYYGTAVADGASCDYAVLTNTNGFSYAGVEKIIDENGELKFNITERFENNGKWEKNQYARPSVASEAEMPVPKTITITAKYGADLRNVWPAALSEESISGNNVNMISWATTQGKYRDDAMNTASSHWDEPTIMGLYATMDEEIIADPSDPGTVHHLVAYWHWSRSYYRYNHCFELPGLDINSEGVQTISLYNDSTDLKDILYLVPANTAAITKFGFSDLLEVSYEDGKVTYGVEDGGYYAVRGYTVDGETKYYAVGRQVETVSTNAINKQNPSARSHMTRANSNADHTARYNDTDGMSWAGNVCGDKGDPYDLYFYYDRDRYTITYMAASTNKEDTELGHIDLPYGAYVTEKKYAFRLNYLDTNQAENEGGVPKYLWTYPDGGEVAVCPDRNKDGNAEWIFKGWGLGPAGVNMQWLMPDDYTPQAQTQADFYIDSDRLLYAIWSPPILTVTFHLNGGHVSSRESIAVSVPANTVYTTVGTIPRPVRNGYTLKGWYIADENGRPTDRNGQPTDTVDDMTAFSFDSVIIEDQHVVAVWATTTGELYSYNVYYVTQTVSDADKDKSFDTVTIDADGNIAESGETYYVLAKEEQTNQIYVPGTVVNLTAKLHSGYVPRETNKTLEVERSGETYNVVFHYDPQTNGGHTVKFVEAGTEKQPTPNVVMTLHVEADQTVLTPNAAALQKLKGYELVSRGDDGNYTAVTNYEDLTWIDEHGQIHKVSTLAGDDIPDTVIYLVWPIEYTITYKNASGSPAEADEALAAVTAADTPAGSVNGKNPTRYTAEDTKNPIPLINPAKVYDTESGEWYQFSHWSLGEGTTVNPGQEDGEPYTTLTIEQGTVGNLSFVANWEVITGGLTVTQTVVGELADLQKAFSFTVTLSDASISGTYGDMHFEGGVATFTLKHGEEKTAPGLPKDVTYTVTQEPDANYDTASTGDTGSIIGGETVTAVFINTRREAVNTGIHDGMDPRSAVAGLFLVLFGAGTYTVCSGRKRRRQGR